MDIEKEIQDELREISPFLSTLEKKNNFSAPEGYFDEFPSMIRDHIGYSSRQGSWANIQRYLLPKYSPWIASLAFLFFVGVFLLWKNTSVTNQRALALKPVSTNEYILDHVDEEIIVEELVTKRENTSIHPDHNKNNEDYILDNVDESTISEEL